jgi:hypothetical protein
MSLKKIAAASVLSALAFSAQANILSDQFIKRELIESSTSNSPANANEHLNARMLNSDSAAKAIFSVWAGYDDQSAIGQRWGELGMNLLRWSDPERRVDWKTARRVQGMTKLVYQQDALVDLDRVAIALNGYPTKMVLGHVVADTMRPNRPTPVTSERLLSQGEAPIGPDFKPIMACQIGQSAEAPYVELSDTQRKQFSARTGMVFSNCLSGNLATAYWSARYTDFVDKYHDRKPVNASQRAKQD